jgi:hypothetical protein
MLTSIKDPTRPASKVVVPRPPAPIKGNQAAILLSKRPYVPNPASIQAFREVPPVSDNNYAVKMQLSRISKASIPHAPFFPKKPMESGITKEMVEDFKMKERESLLRNGVVHPQLNLDIVDLPTDFPETVRRFREVTLQEERDALRKVARDFEALSRQINQIKKEKKDDYDAFDTFMQGNPSPVDATRATQMYRTNQTNFKELLDEMGREIKALQLSVGPIKEETLRKLQAVKDAESQISELEQKNKTEFQKYETQLRELNQGLSLGKMVGESDEQYKQRLMNYEYENVDLITEEEVKNHTNQVFKNNLHKVLTLPMYLEERLINTIPASRLFELNEKWPLVEKKFTETYGKFPLLGERNMTSLEIFFVNVVPESKAPSKSKVPIPVPVPPVPPVPVSTQFASTRPVALPRVPVSTQFVSTRPVASPQVPSSVTKKDLVEYIKSKGGKANMGMLKSQLEQIASTL